MNKNDFYGRICEFENLYLAYRRARKGKRFRPQVADFICHQEDELLDLQQALLNQTYQPGGYHSFYIHDPKRRLISAASFRDRVVHHALCQVIEPLWEPRFIYDCYANRVGKGTHRALDRTQEYARKYAYFLQCDLRQYFPSIDHQVLLGKLARYIKDQAVLALCAKILGSGVGVLSEAYDMVYFPGDDLFAAARPRGLPIGNLTSQFWANIHLNDFDHFVKRQLHCQGYIRYVDDFLLFSDDKRQLHQWRQEIIAEMAKLRLTLHENSAQVFPTRTGIPFLGFRVFPDHRRVKRRNVVKFRRRLKILLQGVAEREDGFEKLDLGVKSWVNHVRYADTWGLRRAVLGEVVV